MGTVNLPQQPTSFIGRSDEIADIANRLDDPNCRLLTLVGPGGIGKTRLAIEVSSHLSCAFPDGVYFVALQPVASVENVIPTLASAIGFEFLESNNLALQLLSYLQDKRLLLILDNYEHLLPATAVVTELLNGVLQSKLLITSRVALNLRDEWLFHVTGMPYPEGKSVDMLDAYSAVKLFVERAQRMRHDFLLAKEAVNVVRVCQLVEGIPLGLELAATWLRRMPCVEIVLQIERSLDFLETDICGIPDRHRSMRVVLDYSWQLLSEDQQKVLTGLSVFRGGFRREAAEQVVGASLHTLSGLVDRSMLWFRSDGRYEMHELERQYAEERLGEVPQEKIAVRNRHCAYFLEFMCQSERNFIGAGNKKTLQAIDVEIDNVRAAWNWAVERKRANDLFKAMRGLYWFCWMRSWHLEGEQAFARAVTALRDTNSTDESQRALGFALAMLGAMDIWQGRAQQAKERIQESVSILRCLNAQPELAWAVGALGWAAHGMQDWQSAKPLLLEGATLHEETGQYEYQAFMFNLLGSMSYTLGQHIESKHWQQQALLLGRRIGDQRTIAHALSALADIAQTQGEYARAHQLCEESLVVSRAHAMDVFTVNSLQQLGHIAEAMGDFEKAQDYLQESLAIATGWGKSPSIAWSLIYLGHVMVAQNEYETARKYYQEAQAFLPELVSDRFYAHKLAGLGRIALRSGDYAEAQRLYHESLLVCRQIGDQKYIVHHLASLGVIAMNQGDHAQSRRYLLESLREGLDTSVPPIILNTITGIAELFMRQDNLTQAVRLASLVANHSASWAETQGRAEQVLTYSDAEMSAPDLELAVQYGADADLNTLATELVEHLTTLIQQPLVEPLSERELAVLQLVAAGKSNREIARDLTLALGTVKSHLHNIMQKLDAESRTEAVMRARNLRLL